VTVSTLNCKAVDRSIDFNEFFTRKLALMMRWLIEIRVLILLLT